MKKLKLNILLTLCGIILAACGNRGEPPDYTEHTYAAATTAVETTNYAYHGIRAAAAVAHISDNFYNRVPFSYQELAAALWVMDELLAMGFAPENVLLQQFYYDAILQSPFNRFQTQAPFIHAPSADMRRYSQNVVLTMPGYGSGIVVVGAHYDSVYTAGASDNASGVGLLLENIYHMRYVDNYHTLIYVFFGAEEIGLVGAYYFINSLSEDAADELLFMINADVVLEGEHLFFIADGSYGDAAVARVFDVVESMYDDFAIELLYAPHLSFLNSDHIIFWAAGHPAMFIASKAVLDGGFLDFLTMFPILHSWRDNVQYLQENHASMMESNLRHASIFLQRLTLSRFN